MPERIGKPGGVLSPRLVVEVTLSGRVVLVAHVGLHRVGIELRDRRRTEGMAQIMEPKTAEASALEGVVVTAPECPNVAWISDCSQPSKLPGCGSRRCRRRTPACTASWSSLRGLTPPDRSERVVFPAVAGFADQP